MPKTMIACAAIAMIGFLAPSAHAEDLVLQPVQVGVETVRYIHGQATIDLHQANGVVEITTLPRDHGGLAFGVAVYNAGGAPALIDTSSFTIEAGKQVIAAQTVDRLVHKAEHRAGWSKFGTRLLGGLAAGLAASSTDTYTGTVYTPYGIYSSSVSVPSVEGQIVAGHILDHTYAKVEAIQDNLDATRAQLGAVTLQTTTVDPGRSYGGRIVFDKLANAAAPQDLAVRVNWNGELYLFGFRLAKSGTPLPAFATTVLAPVPARGTPNETAKLIPASVAIANQSNGDRNAFPRPTRASIATTGAVSPRINAVVQKTADYYIHPLQFEDGSVATHFAASGSQLSMVVKVAGAQPSVDRTKERVTQNICTHRAMIPVIGQGGSISASIIHGNGQSAGHVVLDAQTCNLGSTTS